MNKKKTYNLIKIMFIRTNMIETRARARVDRLVLTKTRIHLAYIPSCKYSQPHPTIKRTQKVYAKYAVDHHQLSTKYL